MPGGRADGGHVVAEPHDPQRRQRHCRQAVRPVVGAHPRSREFHPLRMRAMLLAYEGQEVGGLFLTLDTHTEQDLFFSYINNDTQKHRLADTYSKNMFDIM